MNPDLIAGAVAVGFAVLMVVIVAIMTIKSLIVIVPPNMAAVLTGRKRKLPSGDTVGYRSVIGGRTLRVPIIETVQYTSLETFPIEISVTNAFSKGNIPLSIEAIAAVEDRLGARDRLQQCGGADPGQDRGGDHVHGQGYPHGKPPWGPCHPHS